MILLLALRAMTSAYEFPITRQTGIISAADPYNEKSYKREPWKLSNERPTIEDVGYTD